MRDYAGMTADEMHAVFQEWNEAELSSYLIEITRDILAYKDTDGQPIVDKILDTAGQKGTGKWTAVSALDEGVPLTLSLIHISIPHWQVGSSAASSSHCSPSTNGTASNGDGWSL